jgi:outer membrane biogenesis lipoprotein LolB
MDMKPMNAAVAIVATAVLVACASPAEASIVRDHALVSHDTAAVFRAAGAALERIVDAAFMRAAVELGGPDVAMHAR